MQMLKLKLVTGWSSTFQSLFIFVSDFFLTYLYLNLTLAIVMKKGGDEVEKLVQLSVLIRVRIAKVFHFVRKYMGVKRMMYSNIAFIVKEHWRSDFVSFLIFALFWMI